MKKILLSLAFLGAISLDPGAGAALHAAEFAANETEAAAEDRLSQDVKRLVQQLGSRKFAEREAAARLLIAIGVPAFSQLREATAHADPEVRYRAEGILAEIRQRDFHRRLKAFADNIESSEEYDLPGWKDFRSLAGDTPEARDLFVKMQSEEPRLLQAYEDGRAVGDLLSARTLQMVQPLRTGDPQDISLGSAATILFLAGRESVPITDLAASGVYRACIDENLRASAQSGPYREILREMLSAWIQRETSANTDYQKLTLAMQYGLEAGLAPAVEVLEGAGQPPHLRQQAMAAVAKFGDQSHIPLLEQSLTDETVYGTRRTADGKKVDTQMRDAALAALVLLAKQDLADYGMEHVTTAATFGFIPSTAGFETPAAREQALEKWRAYRQKLAQKEE